MSDSFLPHGLQHARLPCPSLSQRIDAFKLWCWRGLLRVPWTARRSNQSMLKEINAEYSLERLMLMLKLKVDTLATWCEELTYLKRPWCWERLKAKGEGCSRGWDGYIASLTQWTWIWENSGRQWRTEEPGMQQSMRSQRAEYDLVTEQQIFFCKLENFRT